MEKDKMLSTTQAAEIAGVAPNTIRYAVAQGELPGTKLSPRVIVIDRDDLEQWMQSNRRSGPGRKGRPRKDSNK